MTFIKSVHAEQVAPVAVQGVNFDANYFESKTTDKYGVIVLGGSGSGGKPDDFALNIAAMGYNVLSLAYFDSAGSNNVPETLELVPLEYFDAPKKWLMAQSNTRNDGVIIYGLSKGAELTLVLAAHDQDYKGIIALAPSHVVWQGNPKNWANLTQSPSSWSVNGKGLTFVPYVSNEEKLKLGFSNRHRASLTNKNAVAKAKINVGNINSPTLLLTGGKDGSWPAFEMGTEVCAVINNASPSLCSLINYPDGDHLLSNHQQQSFAEVEKFLASLHE